jgi:predicted HAD superfamily Cof-like phosphohydrolase
MTDRWENEGGAYEGFAAEGERLLLELEFPAPKALRVHPLKVTLQNLVSDFHEKFGCAINDRSREAIQFRMELVDEEVGELFEEIFEWIGESGLGEVRDVVDIDFQAVAKEMADTVYVLFGTAVTLGIDLDKAVRLVHESNMSKIGVDGNPKYGPNGKVLKGDDYVEPDLSSCVKELS